MPSVVTTSDGAQVGSYTPASPPPRAPAAGAAAGRVASLDVVRGAVMVLMAIDHVRVYAGVPAGGPSPGVFFTRWVTHFCAPAFVFLAGTAAYLYGQKAGGRALSRFLLTRGAWLVLLELTVLRFAWTFNFDYASFTFAGVIWAIGWSMIVMAGLTRLGTVATGTLGVLIIALHNLVGGLLFRPPARPGWLAQLLYTGGAFPIGGEGGPRLVVLYVLVPWLGVMAAGYAFGAVMRIEPERRRRVCLSLGGALVAAFFVLRGLDLYGDPRPWHAAPAAMPAALAFLSTSKYPASLLFLLMTLGPTILAVGWLEGRPSMRPGPTRALSVFGRVPFFYYVLHIPLIHLVAVGISLVRTPASTGWLFANHPMMPPDVPDGYRWSLALLYAVTAAVVVALYFPCRWFADLKARRSDAWLRYL
ncbi:MAG TPA: heparan-alpha-glucosaminide N-acetyltransferase domain-containing protein [Gemmatimonadaceae bacterium]|nr:heparan-alpha-glucosaminide N-acetyltransferase domain-containing protein [Gemmatimonadaceae bacterium]